MKSIMEEGSSITKAIEKAWIRAGKPEEFSVKIFEEEEKNFFGMTKKSAKIAIFFEEKKHISHSDHKKDAPRKDTRTYTSRESRSSNTPSAQPRRSQQREREYDTTEREFEPRERRHSNANNSRPERSQERRNDTRTPRQQHVSHETEHHAPVERIAQAQPEQITERTDYNQESHAPKMIERTTVERTPKAPDFPQDVVSFARNWLEGILKDIGHEESFELLTTDNTLNFVLKKPITSCPEKEQIFSRSCSYLMMAALRNAFDHDFRNTKIIFTS